MMHLEINYANNTKNILIYKTVNWEILMHSKINSKKRPLADVDSQIVITKYKGELFRSHICYQQPQDSPSDEFQM